MPRVTAFTYRRKKIKYKNQKSIWIWILARHWSRSISRNWKRKKLKNKQLPNETLRFRYKCIHVCLLKRERTKYNAFSNRQTASRFCYSIGHVPVHPVNAMAKWRWLNAVRAIAVHLLSIEFNKLHASTLNQVCMRYMYALRMPEICDFCRVVSCAKFVAWKFQNIRCASRTYRAGQHKKTQRANIIFICTCTWNWNCTLSLFQRPPQECSRSFCIILLLLLVDTASTGSYKSTFRYRLERWARHLLLFSIQFIRLKSVAGPINAYMCVDTADSWFGATNVARFSQQQKKKTKKVFKIWGKKKSCWTRLTSSLHRSSSRSSSTNSKLNNDVLGHQQPWLFIVYVDVLLIHSKGIYCCTSDGVAACLRIYICTSKPYRNVCALAKTLRTTVQNDKNAFLSINK